VITVPLNKSWRIESDEQIEIVFWKGVITLSLNAPVLSALLFAKSKRNVGATIKFIIVNRKNAPFFHR
jgi:hypothetical protein